MKANHEDNTWEYTITGRGKTEVMVKRGSFVFGRNQAAKELRQKPSSVYRRMVKLENMQNLNIKSNTHYSIVSICNWDKYQGDNNTK